MAETVPAELRQTSEVAADLASRIKQHMTRGGGTMGHNDPNAAAEGQQADFPADASGASAPASMTSTGSEQQHQEHRDSVPEGLRHTSEAAADLASRCAGIDGGCCQLWHKCRSRWSSACVRYGVAMNPEGGGQPWASRAVHDTAMQCPEIRAHSYLTVKAGSYWNSLLHSWSVQQVTPIVYMPSNSCASCPRIAPSPGSSPPSPPHWSAGTSCAPATPTRPRAATRTTSRRLAAQRASRVSGYHVR